MKSRPLLFSAPMVLAILDGRKTMTRRLLNPQPVFGRDGSYWYPRVPRDPSGPGCERHYANENHFRRGVVQDFGTCVPGDQIWVKESWRAEKRYDNTRPCDIPEEAIIWHEAEGAAFFEWGRLRPSIFMRRWMSRLTLELTEVRVERLQDISEEDAKLEGVQPSEAAVVFQGCGHWHDSIDEARACPDATRRPDLEMTARGAFAILWDSINGKREGAAWADNPLVWILGFRRLAQEEAA